MKISRSKRTLEVLRFIVENEEPKTLYEIGNSLKVLDKSSDRVRSSNAKKLIPWGSLDLAIKNLRKNNLILIDREKSEDKGRNATIYVPTFKGLIAYLESFEFPKKPSIEFNNNEKSIFINAHFPNTEKAYLDKILRRNGMHLKYPLFQEIQSLNFHPRLYELFIRIAKEVLSSAFISRLYTNRKNLVDEINELKKKTSERQQLFRGDPENQFKIVTAEGKEIPFNAIDEYNQKIEYNKMFLNSLSLKEDEFLRESYFLAFLRFSPYYQNRQPSQELYNYTSDLMKKKREEFDLLNNELERGLTIFGPQ